VWKGGGCKKERKGGCPIQINASKSLEASRASMILVKDLWVEHKEVIQGHRLSKKEVNAWKEGNGRFGENAPEKQLKESIFYNL